MTVLTTSTLITGAPYYPDTRFFWVRKDREEVVTVTIAMTVWMARAVTIAMTSFFLQNKLCLSSPSAVQTCGLQRCLFEGLTRLQMTKRVELFRVKEFVAAALGAYDKAWWCLFRQIVLLDVRDPVTITLMSFLLTLRWYYPSTPASTIILLTR